MGDVMESGYLKLYRNGELGERIGKSHGLLEQCRLCPRNCGVNRLEDERGFCGVGALAEVASYSPHFGEESVLVGTGGSGTIFFCGCNLRCVFCQNYDISHQHPGSCYEMDDGQLAGVMIELQRQGCHNINFVTPSHLVPQILAALPIAIEHGLNLPLVYNSGGYDSPETLHLLEGIVDIYMPDFKFWQPETSKRYMKAKDYPEVARSALIEMQRQVGDLQVDSRRVATRGLLVRHLLMPGGEAETEEILRFLAEQISQDCYLNIMDQYRPCGRAAEFAEIASGIDPEQYRHAVDMAQSFGLHRLDTRDLGGLLKMLFRE